MKREVRHRLLEGVLLRLARLPDAGGLAVRGGMLLRHWFRPEARPARDLDLVAPSPLTVEDAVGRHLALFADDAGDGVAFDAGSLHVAAIWEHTANPGVRVHVTGVVDGVAGEVQVDITGGPAPRPAAILGDLQAASGRTARVWMCRPEGVAGQKVQALWQHGVHCWRPKDLDDLHRLLMKVPMDAAALRDAIAAYLADVGGSVNDAGSIFGPAAWWGLKMAAARWGDHAASAGWSVPPDLAAVVAEVRERLASILEGSP